MLSPQATPKTSKRKGIVTDDTESPKKLFKASTIIRPDPDEAVRVPYEIHEKLYHFTNDEIQDYLDKEEKMKNDVKEANLLEMSKPELIKIKKAKELRKKRCDQYMWTTTNKLKSEPITDVKIHPNTEPAVIT
nr:hypothetical protein [Tanacetum cinerariifolium]